MNYSTAVFLINNDVRAVWCEYENEERNNTRTMFKTMDPDIKAGDLVVVPTKTRHNRTVVKVVEVDIEPDLQSHTKIDWIVSVVDQTAYSKVLDDEAQAIATIKAAQKTKEREELRKTLLADTAELQALPIYTATAIEASPSEQPPAQGKQEG